MTRKAWVYWRHTKGFCISTPNWHTMVECMGKNFNNAYITVWTAPTMCLCDSHFCCTFLHFHTASPWTNYLKDRSHGDWYASNPQRTEAYVCHSKERFVMIFFFSSLHLKDRQQGKSEKEHSEAALEKIKCWLKWENCEAQKEKRKMEIKAGRKQQGQRLIPHS